MLLQAPNHYFDPAAVRAMLAERGHRNATGGMWEEIGQLQLDFLLEQGLQPGHRILDIGCGTLRAGVKLAAYLDPGHYYGTDVSADLLWAGYDGEVEHTALRDRLPRTSLAVCADFEVPFEGVFDFAIAQSVFTHLPLAYFRRCLEQTRPHIAPEGRFYFTFFRAPHPSDDHSHIERMPGIVTHPDADPYHQSVEELSEAAAGTGWRLRHIGDWRHPRGQEIALLSLA